MTERGVVLLPTFSRDGNAVRTYGLQTLTPLLRKCLLYWERLEVPNNNIIHLGSTSEMEELASLGALSRTDIRVETSGPLVDLWIDALFQVYENLNRDEPGLWSLAQTGDSLEIPAKFSQSTRGLQIELISALPVPDESVPFEDILQFRQRRTDELEALRIRINELYQKVLSAPDFHAAQVTAIESLQLAIADLRRSMNETFLTRVLRSAKFEFNLGTLAGVLLGLTTSEFPLNILSGLGGGALSSIKFEKGGFIPKGTTEAGPYAFVHGIISELEVHRDSPMILELGLDKL
jgi:Family of unknown function (DUF6236)